VAENSTPWLIQHEVAQGLIARNESGLLPDRFTGRWSHATHDDVTDFTRRVATHHVDNFATFHGATFPCFIAQS
jgi:hypothetical protein